MKGQTSSRAPDALIEFFVAKHYNSTLLASILLLQGLHMCQSKGTSNRFSAYKTPSLDIL